MRQNRNFFEKTIAILKESVRNFQQNEPIVYSAAIAFFTIFSLPAILIVLTLAGSVFFAEETVRREIVGQMEELMSEQVGGQVDDILRNVTEMPMSFWSVLIGFAITAKSATIIFFIMQKALNSVWKIRVKHNVNYLKFLKYRLVTLAIVAGLGFLLLSSLLLDAALLVFSDQLYDLLEEHLSSAIRLIKAALSLLVVLLFFTAIHKILPDASINWRDALAGGIITSILFLIGKELIDYILSNIKVVGIYAAAGSFVIVLLWVFYSSVILMLGAEVTKAYANEHGREVKPSEIAERYEKVNGD
ncbi:YihY/virulence factor BrkB family protein [Pontibacter sp. JH31]|uniref:YihY/virulence factor BrkB family protein n=1 Tax=Pontibacter aquaedesilientis TaxID=2766980 RepID=A0ABR7XFN5_9BACT|nr:YihY/virulence factor BrkB family protein [Pontibacter aquaedesilientis]MBD1397110.1 YihY/virulence factor BrkB family protein [Pontibacter aquaedesilientis]